MNIIFIAPPAAGKGTQSSLLKEKYGYTHLATGDLLRKEIKKKTNLGTKIENIISKGELVSDEIITELLKKELGNTKHQNFILDGYPRNLNQAQTLSNIFNELNIENYVTIYLSIEEGIAKKRALGRVICSECGASYNTYFQNLKPKKNGICNKCQGVLVQRTDDNEETFTRRFETYVKVTKPLLEYYKNLNKLRIIDASHESDKTFADIEKILKSESVDN